MNVRQTDTGAVVVDDRWVWASWGRWKPLSDEKNGSKPGRTEANQARELVRGASAQTRAQKAGDELLKAVKEQGSLHAAEGALRESRLPGFKFEAESVGNYFTPPSAEIKEGMLLVRGQQQRNQLTQPSIEVPLSAVTGVAVQRLSLMNALLVLQGQGTELGRVAGGQVQADKTAAWIRERLMPQQPVQVNVQQQPRDVTGELERLTKLLEQGVLTQSEFDGLKAKLLESM